MASHRPPTPADVPAIIGARLRAVRHGRGLSLRAVAAAAQIGKGSLSELENGSRNPTIATLYALAGALDVPFATLLDDRSGTEVSSPGLSVTLLDSHRTDTETIEIYRLRFTAGAVREADPHRRGVHEHLLVTGGRLRAGPLDHQAELRPGDHADWPGDVSHRYAALGDTHAEAVLVMRSPLSGPVG